MLQQPSRQPESAKKPGPNNNNDVQVNNVPAINNAVSTSGNNQARVNNPAQVNNNASKINLIGHTPDELYGLLSYFLPSQKGIKVMRPLVYSPGNYDYQMDPHFGTDDGHSKQVSTEISTILATIKGSRLNPKATHDYNFKHLIVPVCQKTIEKLQDLDKANLTHKWSLLVVSMAKKNEPILTYVDPQITDENLPFHPSAIGHFAQHTTSNMVYHIPAEKYGVTNETSGTLVIEMAISMMGRNMSNELKEAAVKELMNSRISASAFKTEEEEIDFYNKAIQMSWADLITNEKMRDSRPPLLKANPYLEIGSPNPIINSCLEAPNNSLYTMFDLKISQLFHKKILQMLKKPNPNQANTALVNIEKNKQWPTSIVLSEQTRGAASIQTDKPQSFTHYFSLACEAAKINNPNYVSWLLGVTSKNLIEKYIDKGLVNQSSDVNQKSLNYTHFKRIFKFKANHAIEQILLSLLNLINTGILTENQKAHFINEYKQMISGVLLELGHTILEDFLILPNQLDAKNLVVEVQASRANANYAKRVPPLGESLYRLMREKLLPVLLSEMNEIMVLINTMKTEDDLNDIWKKVFGVWQDNYQELFRNGSAVLLDLKEKSFLPDVPCEIARIETINEIQTQLEAEAFNGKPSEGFNSISHTLPDEYYVKRTNPLHVTVEETVKVKEHLLNSFGKVGVNDKDICGRTIAHYAVFFNAFDVLKVLETLGADLTLVDMFGKTPLDMHNYSNEDHLKKVRDEHMAKAPSALCTEMEKAVRLRQTFIDDTKSFGEKVAYKFKYGNYTEKQQAIDKILLPQFKRVLQAAKQAGDDSILLYYIRNNLIYGTEFECGELESMDNYESVKRFHEQQGNLASKLAQPNVEATAKKNNDNNQVVQIYSAAPDPYDKHKRWEIEHRAFFTWFNDASWSFLEKRKNQNKTEMPFQLSKYPENTAMVLMGLEYQKRLAAQDLEIAKLKDELNLTREELDGANKKIDGLETRLAQMMEKLKKIVEQAPVINPDLQDIVKELKEMASMVSDNNNAQTVAQNPVGQESQRSQQVLKAMGASATSSQGNRYSFLPPTVANLVVDPNIKPKDLAKSVEESVAPTKKI